MPFARGHDAGLTFDELLAQKDPHAWVDFEHGAIDEAACAERGVVGGERDGVEYGNAALLAEREADLAIKPLIFTNGMCRDGARGLPTPPPGPSVVDWPRYSLDRGWCTLHATAWIESGLSAPQPCFAF